MITVLYYDVALYVLCDVYIILVYICIYMLLMYMYTCMYICVCVCARVSQCGVCLLFKCVIFFCKAPRAIFLECGAIKMYIIITGNITKIYNWLRPEYCYFPEVILSIPVGGYNYHTNCVETWSM
jgi:hypothetical protein